MNREPKDAELFIGIVARIGVDTKSVASSIRSELVQYRYKVHEIHVTDLLRAFQSKFSLKTSPCEERYESLIAACNEMRSELGNEVMATLAILNIFQQRNLPNAQVPSPTVRNAFIINQIKRPEEFELLRKVYGEHYIQISCHSDEAIRIDRLISKITDDHPEAPKSTLWDIKARELVHRDESEEGETFGQRVRQVFPLSDVVVDASSAEAVSRSITRFFRILFGDNTITPTREEFAMELANTAAQRSSDSSRQVGAAIVSRRMEIKAVGCNEVAKANGGAYWEGDHPDGREFALGRDYNEQRRRAVLLDIMIRLDEAGAIKTEFQGRANIQTFLESRNDNIIADSQLMDSLEYGRSVHAEMSAITDAARTGVSVAGCILYSNTFPCHNCAKHIVASGISEVVYIHPYPKSYAKELFSDSIVVNPSTEVRNRVIFRQFIGIVGPIYSRLFTKARWKREAGIVVPFDKAVAHFIRRTPLPAYLGIEELLLDELHGRLTELHYFVSQPELPLNGP